MPLLDTALRGLRNALKPGAAEHLLVKPFPRATFSPGVTTTTTTVTETTTRHYRWVVANGSHISAAPSQYSPPSSQGMPLMRGPLRPVPPAFTQIRQASSTLSSSGNKGGTDYGAIYATLAAMGSMYILWKYYSKPASAHTYVSKADEVASENGDVAVIFVLGGPKSNKDQYLDYMVRTKGYNVIRANDLIATEIASHSKMGKKIAEALNRNEEVPAGIMLKLILSAMIGDNKLHRRYAVDDFPRTKDQARLWDDEIGGAIPIYTALRIAAGDDSKPDTDMSPKKMIGRDYQTISDPILSHWTGKSQWIDGTKPDQAFKSLDTILDGIERRLEERLRTTKKEFERDFTPEKREVRETRKFVLGLEGSAPGGTGTSTPTEMRPVDPITTEELRALRAEQMATRGTPEEEKKKREEMLGRISSLSAE